MIRFNSNCKDLEDRDLELSREEEIIGRLLLIKRRINRTISLLESGECSLDSVERLENLLEVIFDGNL